MAFKTGIDLLQKDFQKLKESLDGLYLMNMHFPTTVERTLLNKRTMKMERWTETINTPEELEEANKRFQKKVRRLAEKEIVT